jgi:hypothetical protein
LYIGLFKKETVMTSDPLVDEDGNVYKQGGLSGEWRQQHGLFGSEKDTNLFGQPSIQRNLLGQPAQERNTWGQPVHSAEGKPLFRPTSGSVSAGFGDDAAGVIGLILAVGLLILAFYLASAMMALLARMVGALYRGWQELVRRYPWTMRVVHLLIGMSIVGGLLYLAGFGYQVIAAGAALVPAVWGWLWLTRRLPLIFMPINALLAGGGLWVLASLTRTAWKPSWIVLTAGIPLVGNLPLLLAVLPMVIWLWSLGAKRWRAVFTPLNLLVAGMLLWFLLLRVWTDWQPLWEEFTAPVSLMPPAGWLLLLAPLALWLWHKGYGYWPIPFTALNLLLFGGLLGLVAYHTQPTWLATWREWMAGAPFAAMPLIVISVSPLALWGWNKASRRWTRVLQIPNLLLSGGVLWLIMDRTRSLWEETWRFGWGEIPFYVDPALFVLLLPLAIWVWRQGSRRWPCYWGMVRALTLGLILWWAAERTRAFWQVGWWSVAGEHALDLTVLVGVAPLLIWIWLRAHRQWPEIVTILAWLLVIPVVIWLLGRLLPDSTYLLRTGVALLPVATRGWLVLLGRHPLLGWILILLPVVGLGLLVWLAPDLLLATLIGTYEGLVTQAGVAPPR